MLGLSDGLALGEVDGETLGLAEGDMVGEALGLKLGEAEGDALGDADGLVVVGDADGLVLGLSDGLLDGLADGDKLGDVDGEMLGLDDGDALGLPLGEALGEMLGLVLVSCHRCGKNESTLHVAEPLHKVRDQWRLYRKQQPLTESTISAHPLTSSQITLQAFKLHAVPSQLQLRQPHPASKFQLDAEECGAVLVKSASFPLRQNPPPTFSQDGTCDGGLEGGALHC